jgi:hypothetical protein
MPGYAASRAGKRLRRITAPLPLPDIVKRGTVTMRVHDQRDYYRFGEHAFEDVFLTGLEGVKICTVMTPSRVFGMGREPNRRD